jgi:hypothetical protein
MSFYYIYIYLVWDLEKGKVDKWIWVPWMCWCKLCERREEVEFIYVVERVESLAVIGWHSHYFY